MREREGGMEGGGWQKEMKVIRWRSHPQGGGTGGLRRCWPSQQSSHRTRACVCCVRLSWSDRS